MSQLMKDVKAITIPEGSVKKIEDSNGNIIWQVGPQWTTVWEGNTKFGYGGVTTSTTTLATIPFVSGMKFRVTFTGMNGAIQQYDSGSVTYIPTNRVSPYTSSEITSTYIDTTIIQASAQNTSRSTYYSVRVFYDSSPTSQMLGVGVHKSSSNNYANATFTLTKVEVYK